jgi:hypothetical protein
LREEALGDNQVDPMAAIIAKVVAEVRSCIGFCSSTVLDADTAKTPPNLKDMVVQKIVRTMKGRLLQPLSDDETKEEAVYQQRLRLLTECAWPVDKTDTPIATTTTQPSGGAVEQASVGKRKTTGLDCL